MLTWLDAHAGTALWLGSMTALGLLACALAAFLRSADHRRREALASLWAARRPISALCDSARELRERTEQGASGLKPKDLAALYDGTLAQRIRDVRALKVETLPGPRSIEAAYEAREAAARLMVWLERLNGEPGEARLRIQTIWKALHDAAGNLQRDIAALEASGGRRF